MSHLLAPDWPAKPAVLEIVNKSSGQFKHSVFTNFVCSPRSHPAHQLDIIRGFRPSGLATPFALLDALYRYIFSQVQDLQAVTDILAYNVIGRRTIILCLANLMSMWRCRRPLQEKTVIYASSTRRSRIFSLTRRVRSSGIFHSPFNCMVRKRRGRFTRPGEDL